MDLRKINELVELLRGLQPLKTEYQQKLDKKFRLEFNYNSNHLEGNTLTYSETDLLLFFDDASGEHTLREYEEMKGSDVAYLLMKEWATDKTDYLTEQKIKNLNEILLVRPFWKDAITPSGQATRREIKIGNYKEFPNSVRLPNGEMFNYTSPTDTHIQMGELIQWYREEEEKKELHPIALAALLHYKFVLIHPFDDGNGRVSRLLMNYVLIKNELPPVVIKSANKKEYLSALNKADTGDIESFIEYIAQQLIWSLELSIKAAKGESIDEPGDLDKKIKQLKQKLRVDEKQKIKYTRDSSQMYDALVGSIEPLIEQLQKKVLEFSLLFKNQEDNLYIAAQPSEIRIGEDIDNSLSHLYTVLLDTKLPSDLEIIEQLYSINYKCSLINFRKSTKLLVVDFVIDIIFHKNTFEFIFKESNLSIDKLYHENLSPKEIQLIVEKVGTYIYDSIEKHLES